MRASAAELAVEAAAPALKGDKPKLKLPQRKLGKTGVKVSILGLGGVGFLTDWDNKDAIAQLINEAIDGGIKYFYTAILNAVRKTGRLVVVDEDNPRCSMATDIASLAAAKAFDALRSPVVMVTAPHTPVPLSPPLEDYYVPSVDRVVFAIR